MKNYIKDKYRHKLNDYITLNICNDIYKFFKKTIKVLSTENANLKYFTNDDKLFNFILLFDIHEEVKVIRIYSTLLKTNAKYCFDLEIGKEFFNQIDLIVNHLKSVTWTIEPTGGIKTFHKGQWISLRNFCVERCNQEPIYFGENEDIFLDSLLNTSMDEIEMLTDLKMDHK